MTAKHLGPYKVEPSAMEAPDYEAAMAYAREVLDEDDHGSCGPSCRMRCIASAFIEQGKDVAMLREQIAHLQRAVSIQPLEVKNCGYSVSAVAYADMAVVRRENEQLRDRYSALRLRVERVVGEMRERSSVGRGVLRAWADQLEGKSP